MRERIDMCPSLFTVSPSKILFYICTFSTLYKAKQKYVCFRSHAKNILGQSVWNDLFLTLVFITELMLDGIYNAFLHVLFMRNI